MTIETKYNIGDEVWGAAHEEIWSGRITAISTYHHFGMSCIVYKVFVEKEMHFYFKEQDLSPPKKNC